MFVFAIVIVFCITLVIAISVGNQFICICIDRCVVCLWCIYQSSEQVVKMLMIFHLLGILYTNQYYVRIFPD
jgi:hypothetical protein